MIHVQSFAYENNTNALMKYIHFLLNDDINDILSLIIILYDLGNIDFNMHYLDILKNREHIYLQLHSTSGPSNAADQFKRIISAGGANS